MGWCEDYTEEESVIYYVQCIETARIIIAKQEQKFSDVAFATKVWLTDFAYNNLISQIQFFDESDNRIYRDDAANQVRMRYFVYVCNSPQKTDAF
jgi:hypothetical protein